MRVAVLIIGLIIGLISMVQACSVYSLSGASDALQGAGQSGTTSAGAVGILTALLILVAAGFVMPYPRVATGILIIAGLMGVVVGGSSKFQDQLVWGVAAFVLAAMAYVGSRQKRRDDLAKAQDRATLATVVAGAAAAQSSSASIPSMPPPMSTTSTASDLERLAALHKGGSLTDAEYAAAKAKLLG
jgi:hypothetical protein